MKSEAYLKSVMQDRESWRLEQRQVCMSCGDSSRWPPLAVHEIERRSHAIKCWAHRCNYVLLCTSCHAGEFACMPHAKQLAYKLIADPLHFDLPSWLMLRDPELRAPNRVMMSEVEEWARRLRTSL